MIDATPPGDTLYKCSVAQEQVVYCDDILKRLAEDEAVIGAYRTQDEVNRHIRDDYNDLLTKYLMLIQMYQQLEDSQPKTRPLI